MLLAESPAGEETRGGSVIGMSYLDEISVCYFLNISFTSEGISWRACLSRQFVS